MSTKSNRKPSGSKVKAFTFDAAEFLGPLRTTDDLHRAVFHSLDFAGGLAATLGSLSVSHSLAAMSGDASPGPADAAKAVPLRFDTSRVTCPTAADAIYVVYSVGEYVRAAIDSPLGQPFIDVWDDVRTFTDREGRTITEQSDHHLAAGIYLSAVTAVTMQLAPYESEAIAELRTNPSQWGIVLASRDWIAKQVARVMAAGVDLRPRLLKEFAKVKAASPDTIPPIDGPNWIRSAVVAKMRSVGNDALDKARSRGDRSPDGLSGRDVHGCAWRKNGTAEQSPILYYRPDVDRQLGR